VSRSDIALVCVFALFVGVTTTLARAWPGDTGQVTVYASPWASPETALMIAARAGGRVVSGTRVRWAVIARSDDPVFVSRLYSAGAMFVADPFGARVCGIQSSKRT